MTERSPFRPNSLPTGTDTASGKDVADPHPEVHEERDKVPNPGGTPQRPGPDIGPNSYVHDGTPPPKPNYRR